jgi:hypothetical protein
MADRDDLHDQLVEAFEGAAYPVTSPMDLLPALPEGPETTFESGEFAMTAGELNSEIWTDVDFPFRDAESLADEVVATLAAEEYLTE